MILYLIFLFRWNCACIYRFRRLGENKREWLKDISCMYHWQKSKHYKNKFTKAR